MRKVILILLLLSSVATVASADDKKNKFVMNKNPDQWIELARVADVVAEQRCGNWAWAAAMEAILARQKVNLDQRYWVMKVNGGLACLDSAGTFEDLKRRVDGEYTLDDHRHVRLEVRYRESLPPTTDALIMPMAQGRPYMLWWKGQPYLVKGATWDDFIYQTGQKLVEIKTLKLVDTLERGEKRNLTFDRVTDNTADLTAMFDVVVTELDFDPWKAPHNPATDPVKNPAIDK